MDDADDIERLLSRAADGDAGAAHALLDRYRPRLKRMFRVRMDEGLAARLDDSDLVQETLAAATARLPGYLSERPVPFYPWLRRLAQACLADAHRHHGAARRAAGREEPGGLPDRSAVELARRLVCPKSSPSGAAARRELRERARTALAALEEKDREVLVLYYLERLTIPELADVLGLPEEAAKSRRRRAILKLGALLKDLREEYGG